MKIVLFTLGLVATTLIIGGIGVIMLADMLMDDNLWSEDDELAYRKVCEEVG